MGGVNAIRLPMGSGRAERLGRPRASRVLVGVGSARWPMGKGISRPCMHFAALTFHLGSRSHNAVGEPRRRRPGSFA